MSGKPTITAKKISGALEIKLEKIFVVASDPKPLSNKTIQHHHRLLSIVFNDAVHWGMMKENPCAKVKPPKVTPKEMSCLDEAKVSQLLDCLESEPIKYQTIITLALVTGCRRGEIVALPWENIDLDNNTIHVKQAASYTPLTGIQVKRPKTPSSIRSITIPGSTVQLLKQYKKWQLEEKIKVADQWQKDAKGEQGDSWKDPNWVFTTWNGYIMHPDSITDIFKKFIKRHNLPDIRLHDIRHTSCTLLIQAGLNIRAVAARMGHANPNVTLAVYSHALQSADQKAANVLEGFMTKNKDSLQKAE